MQDVAGVDEQVRPEVVGDFVAEFDDFPLGRTPGEVGIRLREAELGQPVLACRRRKSFG